MTKRLLQLMLILAVPVSAGTLAAPLEAVPEGNYRPLKAAETERIEDGFEAAWLTAMGEQAGIAISPGIDPDRAGLEFGAIDSGVTYYTSGIAALTATSSGPTRWEDLSGQTFCVVDGSPRAAFVMSAYGGKARTYPSAAQALIGLKLGECVAVVDDQVLLQQIAALPEWRRYNRLLPSISGQTITLRLKARDMKLQEQIERAASSRQGKERSANITQHWIDEVAFQAYVLADTLDCH